MSEVTKIEWADSTFNPWIGCARISPACDHCYAARSMPARTLGVEWGVGEPRQRTGAANWREPLKWERQAAEFQAQHGRRRRVFCASLADVFDNEVDPAWQVDLFRLIVQTPNLDWLLLTKRIGNARQTLVGEITGLLRQLGENVPQWPWPNVWLGATVVNQAEAERDIPKLLAVPAAVRFLSIEPMLGPIDLERPRPGPDLDQGGGKMICQPWLIQSGIDWVIVGGESGPGARPMHPDWARSLRDQCTAAGVPMLFKQWGEYSLHEVDATGNIEPGMSLQHLDASHLRTWREGWVQPEAKSNAFDLFKPGNVIAQRVGKKAAGRLLDGRMHDGFPGVVA